MTITLEGVNKHSQYIGLLVGRHQGTIENVKLLIAKFQQTLIILVTCLGGVLVMQIVILKLIMLMLI